MLNYSFNNYPLKTVKDAHFHDVQTSDCFILWITTKRQNYPTKNKTEQRMNEAGILKVIKIQPLKQTNTTNKILHANIIHVVYHSWEGLLTTLTLFLHLPASHSLDDLQTFPRWR